MKVIWSFAVPTILVLLGACTGLNGSDSGAQHLGSEGDGEVGEGGPDSVDDGVEDEPSDSACDCSGEADLPYNVDLPLGASFKLTDAFLQEGPLPAAILELTMEAPEWRLPELASNTEYTVTQADCDHEGNHGTGRDRVFITWQNADASVESDHFTIRYCEDGGGSDDPPDTDDCSCGEGGGGAGEGGAAPPPGGQGGAAPEPR